MVYEVSYYFIQFLTYSIIGWLAEVISCSIIEKRWIFTRGFLIGPYCPIYGTASLVMIFFLKRYRNDPIALFIMAVVICTFIEYLSSYLMEKLFKARWWDYSEKKYNINGRVCLETSTLFGILALFLLYIAEPCYRTILNKIPKNMLIIIAAFLLFLFLIDVSISYILMNKIKKNTNLLMRKDSTEEISKQVKEALEKQKVLIRRILNSFPNATILGDKKRINQLRDMVKKQIEKSKKTMKK